MHETSLCVFVLCVYIFSKEYYYQYTKLKKETTEKVFHYNIISLPPRLKRDMMITWRNCNKFLEQKSSYLQVFLVVRDVRHKKKCQRKERKTFFRCILNVYQAVIKLFRDKVNFSEVFSCKTFFRIYFKFILFKISIGII